MRRYSLSFAVLFVLMGLFGTLKAQDTTIVQTLTFDSVARSGTWMFPADTGQTYRKIIMQYRMRCHNAAVGNGFVGCYEWDYSCNTLIRDSSQVDSAKLNHPTHRVTGFSGPNFDYVFSPTYDFVSDTQQLVINNSTISETSYGIGSGATAGASPFRTSIQDAKSQYLWQASELTTAGLSAGPLTGLRLDLNALGSDLRYLRVRIRHTAATALDEIVPDGPQWTQVYFLDTQFPGTGTQMLPFYQNFTWDGTSNLLVEFSYSLNAAGSDYTVQNDPQGYNVGVASPTHDGYIPFDGSDDRIVWTPSGGNQSFSKMTVEFWAKVTSPNQAQYSSFFNTGSTGRDFQIDLNGSGVIRFTGDNQSATFGNVTGDWQHIAVVIDSQAQGTFLYLDGVKVDSSGGGLQDNLIQDLTIGENRGGNTRIEADMDEIRVWNTARTTSEIQNNMYKRLQGNESGLYAYYRFDDGQSSPATDASPNGRDGTKLGGVMQGWYNGSDIFRGLPPVTDRPKTTFVRGTYNQTITAVPVTDSIQRPSQEITWFGPNGTDLDTLGIFSGWAAGWQYVYDPAGNVVDSVMAMADSTISIGSFVYYNKRPMDLEIMSFVTPYGNGLDLGVDGVMWEFDMTDFSPVLHGPIYMYMNRGGQNQEEMDIRFLLISGTPPRDVKSVRNIWPIPGILGQPGNNYANYSVDLIQEPRDVVLPLDEDEWKIRTMVTGHGQEGEFIPRTHYMNLDGGNPEWSWNAWTECSELPVYPQGGTWLYDRAGWCPGDPTDLEEFPLDGYAVAGDTINIDYGINTISNPGDTRYLTSHLLVGYNSPNFSLDASVEYVKVPSDQTEHARYNPACSQPVVTIKNTGATPLTSLEITYNVRGGSSLTYSWTGNLDFLESEDVALPLSAQTFWNNATANVFEVLISEPNNGVDENPDNNTYDSRYEPWAQYQGGLSIVWKTNNNGGQTTYKVYDDAGNIVAQNNPFLGANQTYNDDLNLPAGCYKLRFDDQGDDGLYYWATPSNGSGYARFLEYNVIQENFEPEFGGFFEHHFWTDGIVNGDEITIPELISVWPNPSSGIYHVKMDGFTGQDAELQVYDPQGKLIWSAELGAGHGGTVERVIDLSSQPAGWYIMKVQDGERVRVRQLQKM